MAKQNFTPAGVQAKVAELYALPAASLSQETALMRADFGTWLKNNFIFDSSQDAYLSSIDPKYFVAVGSITAIAADAQLPISLVAPTPPGTYSSKFIVLADNLKPRYDSVAGYTVTGNIQYTIGYNI